MPYKTRFCTCKSYRIRNFASSFLEPCKGAYIGVPSSSKNGEKSEKKRQKFVSVRQVNFVQKIKLLVAQPLLSYKSLLCKSTICITKLCFRYDHLLTNLGFVRKKVIAFLLLLCKSYFLTNLCPKGQVATPPRFVSSESYKTEFCTCDHLRCFRYLQVQIFLQIFLLGRAKLYTNFLCRKQSFLLF